MNSTELRGIQAPLKERYRSDPAAAKVTLSAKADLSNQQIACKLSTGKALVEAGLHRATGGDGSAACSGDMLLESLAACAGVTLKAVATALEIPMSGGSVIAEGVLDFRGTLGMAKDAPVGFESIRLRFDLETSASREQISKLIQLTERYCVVYQTLLHPPGIVVDCVESPPQE